MPTFGLPASSASFDDVQYPESDDASKAVPGIDIVRPEDSDHFLSSEDSGMSNIMSHAEIIAEAERKFKLEGETALVPTQPLSQSQPQNHEPPLDRFLVGCLIPASGKCSHFNLSKDKATRAWTIGRSPGNDIVLPGLKLSNFHCTITWNGKKGKRSEVMLVDRSSNGTWVNNVHVVKGGSTILRGGAAISLGMPPDVPNDWRESQISYQDPQCFIFRDIEGQAGANTDLIWTKYDVGHELGSGAFARVHRCLERATGKAFAVKIIDRNKLRRSSSNESAVKREISILKQLAEFRHKNIVTLVEHFEEMDSIYLILELVPGGDLLNYIGMNGRIHEDQVRRMAAQMCHAVAYCHSQGIAHRDLKPENVMVTSTGPSPDCKVADFGLAKLVDNGTFLRTMCGTPAYIAPEVILRYEGQPYDDKVDSWSLGVIFYCMLTNHAPFDSQHPADDEERRIYYSSRSVDWPSLGRLGLSESGHDFLRLLLAFDPRVRKHVCEVLAHPWIEPFVPADVHFQHPLPPPVTVPGSPPSAPAALEACHSMQKLNLSDEAIPGLSLLGEEDAPHVPGAFPVAGGLPQIAEDASWDVVHGAKRKNNLIAGSSPLSSLSPSESDETPPEEEEPPRKRRGSTAAATTATAHRRPPTSRRRGVTSPPEEGVAKRRSARQKATRRS